MNLKRGRSPNETNDTLTVPSLNNRTILYMNLMMMSKLLSSVMSTTKINSAGFRPVKQKNKLFIKMEHNK